MYVYGLYRTTEDENGYFNQRIIGLTNDIETAKYLLEKELQQPVYFKSVHIREENVVYSRLSMRIIGNPDYVVVGTVDDEQNIYTRIGPNIDPYVHYEIVRERVYMSSYDIDIELSRR
jgi:hypothetical protein